jgi:acyl carrier protein
MEKTMNREQAKTEFLTVIQPFVRNVKADQITDETKLVDDLNVHSARLVDVVLEMEDKFSIRIDDEEAGALITVGNAVDLLMSKTQKVAAA